MKKYIRNVGYGLITALGVLTGNAAGEEAVPNSKAKLEIELEENVRGINEGLVRLLEQNNKFVEQIFEKVRNKIEEEKKKNDAYSARVNVYCEKSDEDRYQMGLACLMKDPEARRKYGFEVNKDGKIFAKVTIKKLSGDVFLDVPYLVDAGALKGLESGFVGKGGQSPEPRDLFVLKSGVRAYASKAFNKGREAFLGKSEGTDSFNLEMKAIGRDMAASFKLCEEK